MRNWEVRFALNNGHRQPDLLGPKSANNGSRVLFDHLVGEREQRRRHREAERPGGMVVDDKPARLLLQAPALVIAVHPSVQGHTSMLRHPWRPGAIPAP